MTREDMTRKEPTQPDPSDGRHPLPPHVTLPLLDLITQQSMDEDYRHASERRALRSPAGAAGPDGDEPQDQRARRRRASAVVVAVFGILISVAAVQTSQDADVRALGRASLIDRIQTEKESLTELQDRVGALRAQNIEIEEGLRELRATEQEHAQRVRTIGSRTGNLAVRGPGVRIVVDDAVRGDDILAVRGDDLAVLVDGLWAAGAEAVAINNQRLTALTSVENSGQAILVNVRPLYPPYEVVAIGNPGTLQGRFLETTHGSVWFSLARTLGFTFEMSEDDDLRLPAAQVRTLLHARVGSKDAVPQRKDVEP